MIRVFALLALAAIVAGLTGISSLEDVASSDATPLATPLPTTGLFETPDAVPVSLVIRNDSDADDRLLGGSTPVARRVEVHRTRLVAGRREMRPVADGLAIPAGGILILEPGSSHLMLLGLQAALVQGETFPLTLHFDRAGDVSLSARVRRRVDAAGVPAIPPVVAGDLTMSLASAPPAPAGVLASEHERELD